jgi:hypothetical protein
MNDNLTLSQIDLMQVINLVGTVLGLIFMFITIALMASRIRKKAEPDEPLKPGTCQCGHERCHHMEGKGKCSVAYRHDSDGIRWGCACQIYIPRRDKGYVDPPPSSPSPSGEVEELERLMKR